MIKITEQIKSYIGELEALIKNVSVFYNLEGIVYVDELSSIKSVVDKLSKVSISKGVLRK